MDKLARLSPEDRDNLVAYLDGELDDQQTLDIERILAESQTARHEIEGFSRTWELLDHLPRETASEDFTKRTLESITVLQMPVPWTEKPWVKQAKTGALLVGWCLGLIAAVGLGFAATRFAVPNPGERLVEDYPVVKDLDRYQELGNVEFLEKLQQDRVWNNRTKNVLP